MQRNPELCTDENIKLSTKKLALETFFGESVLVRLTVSGKCSGIPLDEHKFEMLQTVLQTKIYPDLSIDRFRTAIWPTCKTALAELCKRLRRKAKNASV